MGKNHGLYGNVQSILPRLENLTSEQATEYLNGFEETCSTEHWRHLAIGRMGNEQDYEGYSDPILRNLVFMGYKLRNILALRNVTSPLPTPR